MKKRHADWFGPVEKSRLKQGICRNCVICRGIECTDYVNRPEGSGLIREVINRLE